MSRAKRAQREQVVAAEFQAAAAVGAESTRLQAKADADLFVVDAVGTGVRRRQKIAPKPSQKPAKKVTAKRRSVPTQADLGKRKRLCDGDRPKASVDDAVTDIWGAASSSSSAPGKAASSKVRSLPAHAKTAPCHPGISYNPRTEDHQDIVATAVAVELRRNEAKDEKDPMWARALAANSLALAEAEHEGTEEAESESDSEDEDNSGIHIRKRENRGKLTKADRNRRARHRQALNRQRSIKRSKALLKQISSAPELVKNIAAEDKGAASSRTAHTRSMEVTIESKLGRKALNAAVSVNAPSVTVPLSDELHGSIRALKTKSTLIAEQMSAKQFAIDPQLKMKQLLRPADAKPKKKTRSNKKVMPRYRDDPRYFEK